ncbi:MAG: hypothetical protein QMB55_06500 [Propionivibrio sp.]
MQLKSVRRIGVQRVADLLPGFEHRFLAIHSGFLRFKFAELHDALATPPVELRQAQARTNRPRVTAPVSAFATQAPHRECKWPVCHKNRPFFIEVTTRSSGRTTD